MIQRGLWLVALASLLPNAHAAMSTDGVQLGLDMAASFDYEEPGLMSETGWLLGVQARIQDTNPEICSIALAGRMHVGGLNYDGGNQDGDPATSTTNDFIYEITLTFSRLYTPAGYRIRPYFGVGQRYWNDTIDDSTTVFGDPIYGYEREVTYGYLPIGVGIQKVLTGWSWAVTAEYKHFIGGKVRSHLEDVDPASVPWSMTRMMAMASN